MRWLQNFRTAFDVEVQIELKSSNRMREGRFDRISTLQHFPFRVPQQFLQFVVVHCPHVSASI